MKCFLEGHGAIEQRPALFALVARDISSCTWVAGHRRRTLAEPMVGKRISLSLQLARNASMWMYDNV